MSFEVIIDTKSSDLQKILTAEEDREEDSAFHHPVTPEMTSRPSSTAAVDAAVVNGIVNLPTAGNARDLAPIPSMALEILSNIHEEPLPRTKTLSRILAKLLPVKAMTDSSILTAFSCQPKSLLQNHLSDSTNSSLVVISSIPEEWSDPTSLGMGGVGKRTMAALVTSHVDVRRYFQQGIAWVNVGSQEMNYARYCTCLKEMLSQLLPQDKMPTLPVLLRTPCESPSTRQGRQEGFMLYARDVVSSLLQDRNVLIVLNNVEYQSDLDWFQFGQSSGSCSSVHYGMGEVNTSNPKTNSPTVLVVTKRRDLNVSQQDDMVQVDLLYEAEAIRLMVTESGQIIDKSLAETREGRLLVQTCANHPLAVKSVGRWLSLKHAKQIAENSSVGSGGSTHSAMDDVQISLKQVSAALDELVSSNEHNVDVMYEILNMAFSPAVNGKPTMIIKFCFAALVAVFCRDEYHSLVTPLEQQVKIPMACVELFLQAILTLEQDKLMKEGKTFYTQLRDATMLIPEALSALGVVKVIRHAKVSVSEGFDDASDMSYDDDSSSQDGQDANEPVFLQTMHRFFTEYGDYLAKEDGDLQDYCGKDAERQWNKEFVSAFMQNSLTGWDVATTSRPYIVEMIVSHMVRANMVEDACKLLQDQDFCQARVDCMGRKHATRQHITDVEALCDILVKTNNPEEEEERNTQARSFMIHAYKLLGVVLSVEDESDSEDEDEELSSFFEETGRAHYEIGLSLAEKRYWSAAIRHWQTSQEILVSSLGVEEFVAAVLFNIGVAYSELAKHKRAVSVLKRCLRIRTAIHGEQHVLFAQTIQKIGDVFLAISDFDEAMDCYCLALDVMYVSLNYNRMEVGDILENMGNIHYSKGQVEQALHCYQDALHSKRVELGDDHPELAETYKHVGDCLSDQDLPAEAIAHFEEAIRLRRLDPVGGYEKDADILSIEGVLYNLQGKHDEALASYEKCLDILETKVPHKGEKIAALLHLIGCVCLVTGKLERAMKYFERSLALRRDTLGFVQLEVASTLFNVAFLHQTCHRFDEALENLDASLSIRLELLPDSEKVALTHEKIGLIAEIAGDIERAAKSFNETLRIRKLIHGDDHELVALVLHELGDLMDEMRKFDEATKYYEEALEIRRSRLGNDHEDVASTLYSMAFALHQQNRTELAIERFEESLDIRKARLGEDSIEVADTLNMLGFLKAKCGETDSALSLLWEALKVRKHHNDVLKVAEILKNIGNVHREKKELELASECYEECLRIRRDEFGDENEKVADALVAVGSIRSDLEDHDEARIAYEEALSIRTLLHGSDDKSVAEVCQYMGATEFQCGNNRRALRYLQEFVRIQKATTEEKTVEFVKVLLMTGNIHKMENRDSKASDCWNEAYQVFRELELAESDPELEKELLLLIGGDTAHEVDESLQ